MNKIFKQMKRWINDQRESCRAGRVARRVRNLRRESRHVIQAKEFEGKVWLSYGGMPLLAQNDLTTDLPTALAQARKAWVSYRFDSEK